MQGRKLPDFKLPVNRTVQCRIFKFPRTTEEGGDWRESPGTTFENDRGSYTKWPMDLEVVSHPDLDGGSKATLWATEGQFRAIAKANPGRSDVVSLLAEQATGEKYPKVKAWLDKEGTERDEAGPVPKASTSGASASGSGRPRATLASYCSIRWWAYRYFVARGIPPELAQPMAVSVGISADQAGVTELPRFGPEPDNSPDVSDGPGGGPPDDDVPF
jgi:hypothetical protein